VLLIGRCIYEMSVGLLCVALVMFELTVYISFFFFFKQKTAYEIGLGIPAEPLFRSAFLWFVLITLLNVTLIILTLSVSRLLNLLLRLVAFLLFLNPQCLASISRWITASSSWKRFCLF